MATDEIIDIGAHRRHSFSHFGRTELSFRLALKHRFHHFDWETRDDRLTHIGSIIVFFVEVANGLYISLFESVEVRTSLRSILTVYKGVILLAVLSFAVRYGNLNIFTSKVNDRVKKILFIVVFGEEVFEPVFRIVLFTIVVDSKTWVEVYVVFEHTHHILITELEVLKDSVVWNKSYAGTAPFLAFFNGTFFF